VNSSWFRIVGLVGAAGAFLVSNAGDVGAQDVQAVPGPSNLQATAVSSSRIDLKWSKVNTAQVVEYRLYYANGTPIARVPSSQTSYSDTGLQPWTEYRYYVTGANSSGNESGPSNVAAARTLDGSPPSAPGNLAGSAISESQIALSWSAASDPESGIDEYVVYRGASEVGRTSSRTYQDNGLTPDTQYSYQVSAVNGQGDEGSRAGPVQVRTQAEPPPEPPRNLSATPVSASAIDLSWTPPADDGNVASYRIYRNGSPVGTSTGTSYRDNGLASYTTYEYRVTSVDGDGNEGNPSNAASARTLDGTPPSAPGNLAGSAISQTQVSLTWGAAGDPQTGIAEYVVYRGGNEIGRTTSLAYQDNGLTADTQYSYQVSAVNGQGDEGSRAGPVQVRTPANPPPDPPRDLSASAVSASAIDLSWTPPANDGNVASYRIYRNGSPVGTATSTSYRDSGLASYTIYEYRVTSVNGEGDESAPSNAASARTLDGTPPTAPGNLAGSAVSQTQISLTWAAASDPQSGIAQYIVYRDGNEIARTATLAYEDGALESDQAYDYEVSAVNGQGDGGNRAGPIEVRTLSDQAPDPPTGLSASAVDESTVDLAWDTHPDDDDLDGYRVYRDGSFVAGTAGTTYRDTGLDPFTTYIYTVTALGEDGDESSPSQPATVATPDFSPPTVPQNVVATAVGTERIDVSWSESSDAESGIAGYRIFRDGAEIAVTGTAVFQDGELAPGTTYEYQVSAINGAELESDRSDPTSATTPDGSGPSVPTGLSATPVSAESIELSWAPSTDDESGIAYYRVFRDGVEIATPTGITYQDDGLLPATTYQYRVSAVNGEGLESDLSSPTSATTFEVEGPPPPSGLTATPVGPSQISLHWVAPDEGAASYTVFRDGSFIGAVMATTFVDTGLQPATMYRYSVASVDADGIQGARSGEVNATTPPTEDVVPPAPPTGLRLITP